MTTRRAALGDLANRTDRPRGLIDVKKVTNHTGLVDVSSATQAPIDLKNVKARVECWNSQAGRKPLSRNGSLTKPSITGVSATNQAGPKLVKAKSTETATIKEVKLIKRSKSPERQTTTLLKRSDGGLVRRKASAPTVGIVKTERSSASSIVGAEKIPDIRVTKSTPPIEHNGYIIDVPAVQSRFPSYSNGLLNDVSSKIFFFSFSLG